ncbi:hypothetical protein CHCC5025_1142 [Bacillus licheniformis]|nr:hypothetical protein CHCC5025_1142 [Bacillus licheniformis]
MSQKAMALDLAVDKMFRIHSEGSRVILIKEAALMTMTFHLQITENQLISRMMICHFKGEFIGWIKTITREIASNLAK